MNYKEMRREFGCQIRFGKYGLRFLAPNINGGRHFVEVFRLDVTILRETDMKKSLMLDDDLGLEQRTALSQQKKELTDE